jgi:hypothetical protein
LSTKKFSRSILRPRKKEEKASLFWLDALFYLEGNHFSYEEQRTLKMSENNLLKRKKQILTFHFFRYPTEEKIIGNH